MSLDTIDRYISELYAVRNYGRVKEERDQLVIDKKELEDEVAGLRNRLKDEENARERAERELQSKIDENVGLVSKVQELELEVKTLAETGKFVGEEKMTLPQLRDRIATIKSEEITASVNKRLDEEFNKRVDSESDRKSLEKLDQLERDEWPKWLNANVLPMLVKLEALLRESVLNLMKEDWFVTCNRCGFSYSSTLLPEGLNELIRTCSITVDCGNPHCTDLFGFRRYKYKVSFRELIVNHINQLKYR